MVVDKKLLEELIEQARVSERKRHAFLLHNSFKAPSQRLLNALLPETVVPIHRHLSKEETYTILCGRINVRFFDDDGKAVKNIELSTLPSGNVLLVIPKGQWHTVEVIDPSVIFEVSDGPYKPLIQEEYYDRNCKVF